jgi:hypothetical protein
MVARVREFLDTPNVVAISLIVLGAALIVAKHEDAGKVTIAGGLTHLQK